jgi:hypothetical protein
VQVNGVGVHAELVASGTPDDLDVPDIGQCIAQYGYVVLHGGTRILQQPAFSPHATDDAVHRHRAVRLDQQQDQHARQLRVADRHRRTVVVDLDLTHETEFDRHAIPQ